MKVQVWISVSWFYLKCGHNVFFLSCIFFLFWSEMGFHTLSGHSQRGKTQTDWRTTNDGYNEKTSSARHRHNAFGSTCIQSISAPNPKSTLGFHLQLLMPKAFKYKATRWWSWTCSIFRFGDQGEARTFDIYKEKWETEDPKQCWLCIWLFRVNLEEGSSS